MLVPKLLCFTAFCLTGASVVSQDLPQAYNPLLFTRPLAYTARRVKGPVKIDGKINEPAWQKAVWSEPFTDIEGDIKPKPVFTTRMKMLWDDTCLYVAAQLQEPQLNASLRQHDTIVFHNNDFEIFIDPDNDTHNYFEIEVNALNTIFDLFMPKPYRNGSDALIGYDVQGLRSAVHLQGTLNKTSDTDSGWTVEMAIPYRAINFGFRTVYTPAAGNFFRINFSRVEWDWDVSEGQYLKRKDQFGHALPEHNWVWSPQGVINMHFPERWGYVFFGDGKQAAYQVPDSEEIRNYLWLLYYKQKDYQKATRRYAAGLDELNIPAHFRIALKDYHITLSGTDLEFAACINQEGGKRRWTIDEDGKVTVDNI